MPRVDENAVRWARESGRHAASYDVVIDTDTPARYRPRRSAAAPRPAGRVLVPLLTVLALVAGVLSWAVYVHPQVDDPGTADAILVLGGQHDGREQIALDLAREGRAPLVLFTDAYGDDDPVMERICESTPLDYRIECFVPDPFTTLGEAQEVARRADAEGWDRIIAVTFTPHASRARHILSQCFDGEIAMVTSTPPMSPVAWLWQFTYQTAGYARTLVNHC